ncbi:General L-amino acid transport system permease [Bosea sp. LC85]|uniref:flagellin N-terminal helical domain-containing protein n=1 Tax=Bosea sp. LC85 TaxID=1502851 RepID=UPI0004E381AB|nr:flagellin [Bosea sp. LC85]KFC67128.1 General L-amino acid transport system permease [Bosea sp. LC85]
MANTILSSGVRNNLLTLQQTTAQQSVIQNRLATGKKVNSAIDNPVNYFTSASLNDRSSQLTGLLDGISNGIQTIQSASKGIDGVTKLVQSLQSTVKQAQADAAQNRPTKAGTALATATEAAVTSKSLKDIALDKAIVGADALATPATASSSGDLGIINTDTSLAITITAGTTTYTATFNSANTTVRDVVNEINKSGIATAFVDEKGQLNVKGTGSETVAFGFGSGTSPANALTDAQAVGTNANTALGFAANDGAVGTSTITSSNVTSAVRSNLIQQFNDLRDQIDKLAKDSSYNGINLLAGDRLSIVFNEKTGTNQTKLDIQGSTLSAANLGIDQAVNTQLAGFVNFQNDLDLEKATQSLTGALTSLKSLASTLGSNLSVAQTRQDFTKELVNTLKIGADNLVLADPNEEGASLLALNTRQQLSQTALSLANQADQGVLRLFG